MQKYSQIIKWICLDTTEKVQTGCLNLSIHTSYSEHYQILNDDFKKEPNLVILISSEINFGLNPKNARELVVVFASL